MPYKVIQWATGNVGHLALRGIIEHPDLELVGLLVHSREKAGRDAGELVGLPAVGVAATNDVDEILALDADALAKRGWDPLTVGEHWFGVGQAIRVHDDGWLEGGSDPRHDGLSVGRLNA